MSGAALKPRRGGEQLALGAGGAQRQDSCRQEPREWGKALWLIISIIDNLRQWRTYILT